MPQHGDPWAQTPEPKGSQEPQTVCDLFSACKEQERLLRELEGMHQEIGDAVAIREISSDYRKKILANLMEPFIRDGDSAAAAEAKARGLKLYDEDLAAHRKDLAKAEATLARREWLKAALEAIRTTISTERSLLEMR
jgi:hypothetical protein